MSLYPFAKIHSAFTVSLECALDPGRETNYDFGSRRKSLNASSAPRP